MANGIISGRFSIERDGKNHNLWFLGFSHRFIFSTVFYFRIVWDRICLQRFPRLHREPTPSDTRATGSPGDRCVRRQRLGWLELGSGLACTLLLWAGSRAAAGPKSDLDESKGNLVALTTAGLSWRAITQGLQLFWFPKGNRKRNLEVYIRRLILYKVNFDHWETKYKEEPEDKVFGLPNPQWASANCVRIILLLQRHPVGPNHWLQCFLI